MALLFVIVVAVVAAGLWLFLVGLFLEDETNIWYVTWPALRSPKLAANVAKLTELSPLPASSCCVSP
jgi:hypothetical protein